MRLTPDDKLAFWVTINLDGVDVTQFCTLADEEAGLVERMRPVPVAGKKGVFTEGERYTTHGAVKIELDPDAPEHIKTLYLQARAAERAAGGQFA